MRVALLVTGGRTGSDFFQSLLDSHPQIIQFPGVFKFDIFFNKIQNIKNYKLIAEYFINSHQNFFDSKLNLIERHNQLGEDKNEYFEVSKNLFIESFTKLSNQSKDTKKEILINLHKSYYVAANIDTSSIKLLFLHVHHMENLDFYEDLTKHLIYTIRDPIITFQNGIKHWKKYMTLNKKTLNPNSLYFQLNRIIYGISRLNSLSFTVRVIRLEDLHLRNREILNSFCSYFELNYNNNMIESTYFGKKWWGDALSVSYLNGINLNFKNNLDNKFYFQNDIAYIETLLEDFNQAYHYERKLPNQKPIKFLPLKCEIVLAVEYFKKFKFIYFFILLNNYLKRIFKKNQINQQNYPKMFI